jgi:tripartite-type tricarboxylate transporter receptor subunit TctC
MGTIPKPPRWRLGLSAFTATAALAATLIGSETPNAQSKYPDRPIRIVTISTAGGTPDLIARQIGDRMSASFKQPVIVEGRVGAGGSLAAGYVAKAAPDGYTLLMTGDAAMVTNQSLYKTLTYDSVRDLAPISQIAFTTNILAVSNDLPVTSVAELVALARAQPGKLSYAHGGLGFSQHLAAEVFKFTGKLNIEQVPFRGGASVIPDLMTGRVSLCFCNISSILPLAREGKLRGLAVTSAKRSEFAPELPTMAESGFPGFDINAWFGLMAPANTPAAIIERLHRETRQALAQASVRESFGKFGMEIIGNSPTEFAAVIRSEIPQRKQVIEAAGISIQ